MRVPRYHDQDSFFKYRVETSPCSGVFDKARTRLVFYSESCINLFFFEVSRELFELNRFYNKSNLELYSHFFKKMLLNISSQSLEIKLIFFARVFFPKLVDLVDALCTRIREEPDAPISGFQVDAMGNVYKDFYHSIKIKLPLSSTP